MKRANHEGKGWHQPQSAYYSNMNCMYCRIQQTTHLFLAASMSLIFLPFISFPDSFSRAFFRSL